MSFSPTKQRTLARQPSSPSLNLGLPPPLPSMISPSSSSRTLKRSRSRPRIRRGDVESSATSADDYADDDDTDADAFLVPSAMVRASTSIDAQINLTPRRKVAGPIEHATVGRDKGKKRETLAERLASAARVKQSRSVDGLAMASTGSLTSVGSQGEGMILTAAGTVLKDGSSAAGTGAGDKVVVCVRIKPTSSPFLENAYELAPTSLELSDQHPNVIKRGGKQGREAEYAYTFDMLLKQPSKTPDLYASQIAPLVEKAMNGFNSTVFAYGQTGSGKSFTMTGHPAELGVIPCAVDGVFDAITADMDRAFLLRVSYIEIYNETLRDLLNFKKTNKEVPAIHTNKGKVYVDPLVEEIVSTPQDVMKLLSKGNEGRKIGATDWNDRSSRSHCVFTIVIESRPRDGDGDDDIRLSRLNLIDLAGSEKAVSDLERRGEGKHINQSLLALREVINKLTEKKRSHIPYRNSKLTHLLENALGGDSNICVICTISAEEEHASETLETLKFAGRCSQVETKAKKNILMGSERALIRAKDAEIEELRSRLMILAADGNKPDATSSNPQVSELAESVADLEIRKARLKEQLAKLNGEILTSEMPRLGHGLPLSPPRPKRRRISEFLGVGKPKGSVIIDRRAVSGLSKVEEDTVMVVDTVALEDASISSLRRALSAKDAELSLLRNEITQLRTLQAISQNTMLDTQHDLEVTRSDLVSTISSKTLHIDSLDETILDLRRSRQDLLIEDQTRLEGVQRKLQVVLMESERAKRVLDGDLPSEMEAEKEAHRLALDQIAKSHQIEVGRLGAENAKLGGQLRDRWNVAESATKGMKDVEEKNKMLQAEVAASRETVEKYSTLVNGHEALKGKYEEVKEQAKRVDYLESANKAFKAEIERLEVETKRIPPLEGELKATEMKLREVETAKDRLRNERMEAMVKVEELEMATMTSKEEASKANEEKKKAEKELEEFQRKAIGVESEVVAAMKKQLGAIENEREAVRSELSTLQMSVDPERKAAQTEMAALALERDTIRSELAVSLVEISTLRSQLEVSSQHQAGLDSRIQDLQAEAGKAISRIGELESSLDTATRQLAESREMTGGKDAIVLSLQADLSKLAKELDETKATKAGLSEELDILRQTSSATDARAEKLDQELGERRLAAGVLEAQIHTAAAAVDKEMKRAELAEKEAERINSVAKQRAAGLEAELNQVRADLEDRQATAGSAHEALELVRAEHKNAKALIATLTTSTQSAKVEIAEKDRELVSITDQLKVKATELEALQTSSSSSEAKIQQLRGEVDELSRQLENQGSVISSLKRQLEDEQKSRRTIQESLEKAKADVAGSAVCAAELTSTQGQLIESRMRISALEKDIKTSQTQLEMLSKELVDGLAVSRAEVSALEKDINASQIRVEGLTKDMEDARALSRSKISTLEREVLASETRIKEVTKGMTDSRLLSETKISMLERDIQASQARIEGLTKESTDARAAVKASKHHSTLPTIHSSTSLSNLAATSTRQGIAGMRDRAEIDRLEKVIESQQTVIDDQREKIKFWSNELEKQREVVKMLTSTPESQTTPTRSSPAGTRHIKAHSLSSASPGFSPLPTHTTQHSGMPKKCLTSTFTARNLALPTLATPMPMPMHTAQYSNTAQRKGRRITIDHDMDVLSEVSKVGSAKAIFESPEKDHTRSGVARWSDSPKQRRP